jgi:hypothetical protein
MHTPGPWKHKPSIHGKKYRYVQIGENKSYTTLEVEPDDARLIAAAPDLLAALRFILAFYEPSQTVLDSNAWKLAEASARAAIAKAQG